MARIDNASVIGVGAELVALLGARNQLGYRIYSLRRIFVSVLQRLILAGTVRRVEPAGDAIVAVDFFGRDEVAKPNERGMALQNYASRALLAVGRCKLGKA